MIDDNNNGPPKDSFIKWLLVLLFGSVAGSALTVMLGLGNRSFVGAFLIFFIAVILLFIVHKRWNKFANLIHGQELNTTWKTNWLTKKSAFVYNCVRYFFKEKLKYILIIIFIFYAITEIFPIFVMERDRPSPPPETSGFGNPHLPLEDPPTTPIPTAPTTPSPPMLPTPKFAHTQLFGPRNLLYWYAVAEATSYTFAVYFNENRVYYSDYTWTANGNQVHGTVTGALHNLLQKDIQTLDPWEIVIYSHAYGKASSSYSIPMIWIPPATNIHVDGNYLRWNPVETAIQYVVWLEIEDVSTDYKYRISVENNYIDLRHFISWLTRNNIQEGDGIKAVILVYSSAEDGNRYNFYEIQVPSLKLSIPVLAFDSFYGIISWEPVIGADIYDVFIRGSRELTFTTGETYFDLRYHAFATDIYGRYYDTYYIWVVPSNFARTTYAYGDNKFYFLYVLWRFLPTPAPHNTAPSAP